MSFTQANGQLLPMRDIIGELNPKIAGMGNIQAAATLKALGFGGASSKLVETIPGRCRCLRQGIRGCHQARCRTDGGTGSVEQPQGLGGEKPEGWAHRHGHDSGLEVDPSHRRLRQGAQQSSSMDQLALVANLRGLQGRRRHHQRRRDQVRRLHQGATRAHGRRDRSFKGIFTGHWSEVWKGLGDIFKGLWDYTVGSIVGAFGGLGSKLGGIITTAMSAMAGAFVTGFTAIGSFFSGLWGKIVGAIGDLASDFKNLATKGWDAFATAFTTGWTKCRASLLACGARSLLPSVILPATSRMARYQGMGCLVSSIPNRLEQLGWLADGIVEPDHRRHRRLVERLRLGRKHLMHSPMPSRPPGMRLLVGSQDCGTSSPVPSATSPVSSALSQRTPGTVSPMASPPPGPTR